MCHYHALRERKRDIHQEFMHFPRIVPFESRLKFRKRCTNKTSNVYFIAIIRCLLQDGRHSVFATITAEATLAEVLRDNLWVSSYTSVHKLAFLQDDSICKYKSKFDRQPIFFKGYDPIIGHRDERSIGNLAHFTPQYCACASIAQHPSQRFQQERMRNNQMPGK